MLDYGKKVLRYRKVGEIQDTSRGAADDCLPHKCVVDQMIVV